MIKLKKKLDEYRETITELSKTSEGKSFIVENSISMINLDKVAKNLHEITKKSPEDQFATADALHIKVTKNKIELWFFEFKNLDFKKKKDKNMSKFLLDKCVEEMRKCKHDCHIIKDDKSNFTKYLIDKSKISLIKKPYESLSLVYYYLLNEHEEPVAKKKLFKAEKYFVLVSDTEKEYNNFLYSKPSNHPSFKINKTNNHLSFKRKSSKKRESKVSEFQNLRKLHPYHYSNACAIYKEQFESYLKWEFTT